MDRMPPPLLPPPSTRLVRLFVAIVLPLVCAACDKSPSPAPQPGAKPGYATGKLASASGGPLTDVTVSLSAFLADNTAYSKEFEIKGPASEYALQIPDGMYNTPMARVGVWYGDRWYDLPLAATDGTREWPAQRNSKQGLVRDFVFRISGLRPGGNTNEPEDYWGGTVHFDKGGDLGEFAKIEITLKPDGPLIDGSGGQTLLFKRELPWRKPQDHLLYDIPLGKYTATAKLLFGSRPKSLKLISYTIDPQKPEEVPAPEKSTTSVPIEFQTQQVKPGEFRKLIPNLVAFPP
jgi:hypothetical protein